MGLSIVVGALAQAITDDPDGAEFLREAFDAANDLLRENKLPPHVEPEQLPPIISRCDLDGFPYSFLHNLRRVYANLEANPRWSPTGAGEEFDPDSDPVITNQALRGESHLLCHADSEGFYLPIEFKDILIDESERVPGAMLGSSHRLRAELIKIAPALGIRLDAQSLSDAEADRINAATEEATDDLWIERTVWLALFEAARLSIEHRAAICFC